MRAKWRLQFLDSRSRARMVRSTLSSRDACLLLFFSPRVIVDLERSELTTTRKQEVQWR